MGRTRAQDPVPIGRIRVLLVDDHAMVRRGIRRLLESYSDVTVIGEAANGREGVRLGLALSPEVNLMDTNSPDMSGVEACRELKQ